MVKIKKSKEETVTEVLNEKADGSKNEQKAEAVKEKAAGTNMVTVACGIPMGLRLNLASGDVLLEGMPMSHIVSAVKGVGYLPAGKYGLTAVTKEQWEEIVAKYGKYDFMVNGVVFAKEDHDSVVAEAKEKSNKRMGFEQADPKGITTQVK